MISDKIDNEEKKKTAVTDYIARVKEILTKHKASKGLTEELLKVILVMNQESRSKSEEIKVMNEANFHTNSSNMQSSNKEIISKLDEISATMKKKTYLQAASLNPKSNPISAPAAIKKTTNGGYILRLYPSTQGTKVSMSEIKEILLPHLQKHPINRIKEISSVGVLIELAFKSSVSEIAEVLRKKLTDTIKIS